MTGTKKGKFCLATSTVFQGLIVMMLFIENDFLFQMKPIWILLVIMNEICDIYQFLYLHASTVPWSVSL